MSLALGFALYFMIWWLVLFAVLPFGVKTQEEAKDVVPGTPESAPSRFPMRKIFLANTVLATMVFGVVWLALDRNWLGTQLPVEDIPAVTSK
jgi:predicted secreted protein